MNEWKIYKLIDFVEINPTESLKKGTLAKKIGMDLLQPYTRTIPSYTTEFYSGGTKFRNGDTIMARITPCLENGKTAMVSVLEENEIGFGSTEYIVFRAKEKISDPFFVYYLITSSAIREPAIKSMVGSSGRQRVQSDVIANLMLRLPPLQVQKQIGTILSSIDDKIELNNRITENLEQQAQAIFKSWFVDFEPFGGKMPEGWRMGKLSEIADIIMGQSPDGKSYNEDDIGTVFYQGRAEFGTRFPTRRLFTTEPKRIAKKFDTLMSVRAPVGDLNIANEDCCIGRGLAAIHSKDSHQSFIHYTVVFLHPQLDVFNGEGTVFGCINRDALNNMEVLIPSKSDLDKFEQIVAALDNDIFNRTEENQNLVFLRDTLLPKLMSGEIDVNSGQV